ncbi:MAG TPA: ATP-binding cassette domain-containing protein [Mycobacterium sp.]|jgi:ABC-type multidrug transport system fused ATPase/permease subunit|nr:ATP-binding cassette domain-containing protein [Mycobacterium sp.]
MKQPNSVEVVDDSMCSACSPWLSEDYLSGRPDSTDGIETMQTVVTDDRDVPVDGHSALSEIDWLEVDLLGLTLPNGCDLVSNVSFSAGPGSRTAIIGPSGAGRSTLAKPVAGALAPTTGAVGFNGHDLHAEFGSLRPRIGLIPQDDVAHHQFTVEARLRYAAEPRLPDATKDQRSQAMCRLLTGNGSDTACVRVTFAAEATPDGPHSPHHWK